MDYLELARKRYSERRFSDKGVEPDKIAKILEAGGARKTAYQNQDDLRGTAGVPGLL